MSDAKSAYYAKDLAVYRRPIRHVPTKSITMGFRVCTVSEFVGPPGAFAIAKSLNSSEKLGADYEVAS